MKFNSHSKIYYLTPRTRTKILNSNEDERNRLQNLKNYWFDRRFVDGSGDQLDNNKPATRGRGKKFFLCVGVVLISIRIDRYEIQRKIFFQSSDGDEKEI